ncbi:MAG: S9 family peptidase [Steroidobacteraceae bacterium]
MLRLIAILVALSAFNVSAIGQSKTPLTIEAAWQMQRLGGPSLSPDGRLTVVPVSTANMSENKITTDLWLVPTAGGSARQLTSDRANDTDPVFSPDGKHVAFVSKRGDDKENQIYVIPVDGGEARRLTNVPTGAGAPKWFPDGKRLAFVSEIWLDLVKWDDQGKRMQERNESKMSGRIWERAPIAYWDHFLNDREPHLFSIAVEGGEPLAITRLSGFYLSKQEYDSSSYDIAPDGEEMAFAADTNRGPGTMPNEDIITIAACGCKPPRNVTEANKADDTSPAYSPDGQYLAYGAKQIPGFYADRTRLMLHDRKAGSARELFPDWDRSANNLVWAPNSRALYGAIDDAATQRIYRFDLGATRPVAITQSSSFSNLAVADSTIVALRQSFSEPPTLVSVAPPRAGTATKLTTFNDAAVASTDWGRVESIIYKGARNDDVQMWVVYPPGFDATKKYPVYMLLHGGPHNAITDATQWRWNAQVFAAWGYIVTWHNFHGSSGFGQEFTDSINPDRISLPYEDTIKAAEWLKSKPYVDGDRMVAGGGSYGGFLAATLLGREHPFQALIAHAAVYNSYTQIGADYGAEPDRFFEYWDKPEEFARYSPHTSAGNFKTPTLVIHGQLDQRVPVNHGVELFNTLQKRGVPSKFVYFPDENHWVLKPQNSVFWYQTKKDWLAKYAPPGPGK